LYISSTEIKSDPKKHHYNSIRKLYFLEKYGWGQMRRDYLRAWWWIISLILIFKFLSQLSYNEASTRNFTCFYIPTKFWLQLINWYLRLFTLFNNLTQFIIVIVRSSSLNIGDWSLAINTTYLATWHIDGTISTPS
jgi:hypothetical protein